MSNSTNSSKTDALIAGGLILFSLAVYNFTLAPTVLFADGGEFQFVPWLPGIAHPTGYPLYGLLGWLFSHLIPFGEVAWRLNLFSAAAGAIAVGVVYLIALQLTTHVVANSPLPARRLSALSAAMIFAFGYTFWSQAIIAEVYSLHALFVALVLWGALRVNKISHPSAFASLPARGKTASLLAREKNPVYPTTLAFQKTSLLALIFGFSLTHHVTIVLMLPAILLYLWFLKSPSLEEEIRGSKESRPLPNPQVGRGYLNSLKLLIIAALPSLLYFYLPLIVPYTPYIKLELSPNQILVLYHNTLKGFIAHITARVFSGAVQPAAVGPDRLAMSLNFMRQQVGWLGGVLGLAGLFSLRKHATLLALTAGSFLGFLIFNLIYFIGDVYVLFIPCWLILSLWIGLGWFSLARLAGRKLADRHKTPSQENPLLGKATARMKTRLQRLFIIGLSGLLLIFPVVLFVTRYAKVDQSNNTIARDTWQEILAQDLPANAVLLSNDRNEIMPLWYYQYVENRRPGWLGLFPLITPRPEYANVGRALDQALASGRPVYLIKPVPGLEVKADLTALPPLPHAQLFRATRPNLTPAQAVALAYDDNLTISGYDLSRSDETLTVTLYWQVGSTPPAKNYTSYIHLLDAGGQGVTQSDHRPGGDFYPARLWLPGETLRDAHALALPADLPPGQYTLIAGLYFQSEAGAIEGLGEGQILTEISIE